VCVDIVGALAYSVRLTCCARTFVGVILDTKEQYAKG
jgi:hypothetical protein